MHPLQNRQAADNVLGLVNQRHVAKDLHEVVQTLAASLHMSGFPADAETRIHVVVSLVAVGFKRSESSQLRCHVVERNVLAVEVLVDIVADLNRLECIGGVVVEVGNVREAQVRQDHRVMVLTRTVRAKGVLVFALLVLIRAARQSADQAKLSKVAPRLEHPFQIIGRIVDIVVGQEDGLGLVVWVWNEFLVETVHLRHPVPHFDTEIRDVVWRRGLLKVVPNDDDLMQRWDLLGGNRRQGALELIRPLVGLHGDSMIRSRRQLQGQDKKSNGHREYLRELVVPEMGIFGIQGHQRVPGIALVRGTWVEVPRGINVWCDRSAPTKSSWCYPDQEDSEGCGQEQGDDCYADALKKPCVGRPGALRCHGFEGPN